jgi:hypothetical protein
MHHTHLDNVKWEPRRHLEQLILDSPRDKKRYEDDIAASEQVTTALRADPFECKFTRRWLTSLMSRVDEMNLDEAQQPP